MDRSLNPKLDSETSPFATGLGHGRNSNQNRNLTSTSLRFRKPLVSVIFLALFLLVTHPRFMNFSFGHTMDLAVSAPQGSVFVNPLSFAVLGPDGPFRDATQVFNPTHTDPPFFQIFDSRFLDVLGHTPSIRVVVDNSSFNFAHEAPIWVPCTDEVFFASKDGDMEHNNQVSKISLKDAAKAKMGGLIPFTKVPLSSDFQMTNGGTPFHKNLLFANSGRGDARPNLALVHPYPPYNSTVLLDNYFGRQFNSINDVKIHPKSGAVFFTDVSYGYLSGFRPPPKMPNQVYRFDPKTGSVRVVADGFDRCNGVAFSPDGQTAFVTDTGLAGASLGVNQTEPSTIYAYDVDPTTQSFKNRRVFAYADSGIPDGIQLDTNGNVYSGCGDGVQVWAPDGTLIGKFFAGSTSPNFIFAHPGRLVILAETKILVANIRANGALVDLDA